MIESKSNPQFTDSNGTPIFVGDNILIETFYACHMNHLKDRLATVSFRNNLGRFYFTVNDEKPMQYEYGFETVKAFRRY